MSTDDKKEEKKAAGINLSNLRPTPGSRRPRKRIGRGEGSGHGKTAGRGHKGFNSRAGGGVRPGYEGGQMPIYMRLGKLRGSNKKMSMPMGPFRTATVGVNVSRLAGFAEGTTVSPDTLVETGVIKNTKTPVKILGHGELKVALTVRADGFSKSARKKIEAAGGKVEVI